MKKPLTLAVLAIAAAISVFALARSCQPPVTSNATRNTIPIASDRVVTVDAAGRLLGHSAGQSAPTVAQLAVSPGRGVISVSGNTAPVTVRQFSPAVRIVNKAPSGQQTVIAETPARPIETATVDVGGGVVVTSKPEPIELVIKEPEPSRVGIIAGLVPGWVALDVAVVRGRPLQPLGLNVAMSLDLMAGPGAAGAGLAVGDKYFVTGGGCVEWSGRPGWYVAGGVRF